MPTQNERRSLNQPSTLDFSFGSEGNATTLLRGNRVIALAVVKTAGVDQGKILGVCSNGSGPFLLFRLTRDGLLDTTFGEAGTGYAEGRFGASTALSTPQGLTLLDNGAILVIGHVRVSSISDDYPAATLFNSNGTPNLVFGQFTFREPAPQAGPTPPPNAAPATASGGLADTGKILFTVNNSSPGPYRYWGLLIQLTLTGELDPSLDGRGYIFFKHNNQNTSTVGVVTQASGRIILAGSTTDQGFLVGYTATGQRDTSFGDQAGVKAFISADGPIRLNAVRVQTDNKPVAVGTMSNGSKGWVARTLDTGTDDSSFNNGNPVITEVPFARLHWTAADIDANGSIVVAGEVDTRLCIVGRLTGDGRPDTTFSPSGISNHRAEHTPNITTSVAVQTPMQILVAGQKNSVPSVSRYHS
ncbi:hypothetical protein [Pseudomonas frederiksbergensis]|uniref:Delta-60 repeat domain-containing protein n=1 Tax=Pseudomonas frederiksbergensis TaxID=104087 RepID=A0A423KAJ8_9PSED|nr:hypothetical protein [Pseudomonas frederiksbergensis]RON49040.1 hypothetical protein BK665_23750 [Pseudomonas frederiksbergensis]